MTDEGGAARTDPRIERTRAHVLGHARELLTAGGPDAVTYSELAARARVTRQTLYRHWPTRERLLTDLLLEGPPTDYPDGSGSPEHIVAAFLRSLRAGMQAQANATALMMLAAQADHDPQSDQALHRLVANRRDALNQLLAPSGLSVDADEYARLCGPVLFRRFISREPVTDQFIADLAATFASGRPTATH
ncbi:TetR/AcrR family transcriptional regulator [Streptomyces sp. NPDC046557]|uniref:TetR/AcrR family transcriptional regulator n=1 Tax=Streptomyces sp. NPDC046557 TaxID=3155372 RepID=UPI0033CE9424